MSETRVQVESIYKFLGIRLKIGIVSAYDKWSKSNMVTKQEPKARTSDMLRVICDSDFDGKDHGW
jgi:hypothetical protein